MSTGYTAFIPVRGGSRSIPLKNIREIAGKPLVWWALEAAERCPAIDRIVVSTDSVQIENIVTAGQFTKVEIHQRSSASATDEAPTEAVLLDYAGAHADAKNLILIQATSPLLTAADLSRACERFDTGEFDSLLSVVRQRRFCWEERAGTASPLNYHVNARPRRQEFEGMLVENGALYVTSRAALLESGCRLSGRIGLIEMAEETYAELDEPADWPVVEALLRARSHSPDRQSASLPDLARIRALFSDCDGVLTDGGMYYTEFGDEMKRFQTRDGVGFEMLRDRHVLTGIITSEAVDLVRRRAEKLWLDEVHLGVSDKLALVRSLCEQHGLALDEVAYIGDDVGDLEVIKAVGLGCAVRTAIPQVLQAARYVTATRGGEGAVREVAELICAAIDRGNRPQPG